MRRQPTPRPPSDESLAVLIACNHASASYGGEAILPLHHFRMLRDHGFRVWLVAHARTRAELSALFPDETRIHYVEETRLDRWAWRIGRRLPHMLHYATVGFVSRLGTQVAARRLIRRLVAEHAIDVVHLPTPVSPREPTLLHDLGAPVVIGPMNGGMTYPPAFRGRRLGVDRAMLTLGRWIAPLLNRLMPGKHRAALLLVANARTRAALPQGLGRRALELVENGVELDLWAPPSPPRADRGRALTFAFVGRLVTLKAVDLLLEALALARRSAPVRLVVIGDGEARRRLEQQAARLFDPAPDGGAAPATPVVRFTGLLPQTECADQLRAADALVMPSLHDCGGAVVLEAMAISLPVIATAWGGPLDYLDPDCGVLVEPAGRDALVRGFAAAMVRLADAPETRRAMGRAARRKVCATYDWAVKSARMVELYRAVVVAHSGDVRGGRTGPAAGAPGVARPAAARAGAASPTVPPS